jgi:hypothetical protein
MKRYILSSLGLALVVGAAFSVSHARDVRLPVVNVAAHDLGVHRIVSAQPFVLDEAWAHVWRKEQPRFDAGWLVVLEVDPTLVEPKQNLEPVLYAGDQTVERVNHGQESGRVVAIVPCERDARGLPALDLTRTPFWFGTPDLPERVDAAMIHAERARADAKGLAPIEIGETLDVLRLHDRGDLDQRCGLLVLQHSPAEQDLGTGLLVPRLR